MKYKMLLLLLTATLLSNFLQGCQKEKDLYKPYYGTWYAKSCGSNGGPQNCGYPYPIPRDLNITLTLNADKTFVQTHGNFTIQGTYTIQKARKEYWTGTEAEFDKLTQVYNGQNFDSKIEIYGDGSLSVFEKACCSTHTYTR